MIERKFQFKDHKITALNFMDKETQVIIDFKIAPEFKLEADDSSPELLFQEGAPKGFLRIKANLKAKAFNKFSLKFRKPVVTTVAFTSIKQSYLAKITSLDTRMVEKLKQYSELSRKIVSLRQKQSRLHTRNNVVLNDEKRIRKNISSLSKRKEDDRARNNFITKLETLFETFDKLQREYYSLEKTIKEKETELNTIFS